MKCFLHIGTEKTGTTTLQSFFDVNRKLLLKQNMIYTRSAGLGNNRYLSVLGYDVDVRDDFTQTLGIFTDAKLAAFQKKTAHAIRKELSEKISRLGRKEKAVVVFSSEHIQSRLRDVDAITRLKNFLNSLGITDISVVVYLRDPVGITNSLYSTAIKFGHEWKVPPPPDYPYFNNICHHANTIKKFQAVFGEKTVIPRLFERNELVNKSIIDDFSKIIGLDINEQFEIPNSKNISLSPTGIELLRRTNKAVPRFIEERNNPLRQDIVSYFEKHFSDSKYTMPRDLQEQYQTHFAQSNEWVRQNYFPDKTTLFPVKTPNVTSTIDKFNEEEWNRTAAMIADIWNTQTAKTRKLESSFIRWIASFTKFWAKKAYHKIKS